MADRETHLSEGEGRAARGELKAYGRHPEHLSNGWETYWLQTF